MNRAALTEKILEIKRERGLTWKHICDQIGGMSPVMITGALLGNHKLQAAGRQRRQAVQPVEGRRGAAQRGAHARRRRHHAADRSADLSLLRAGAGERPGPGTR
jgi:hypothetical protein